MTRQEKIKEEVKSIFSEDMLLCFWTHERCPPSQQEFKQCQLDSKIKHERCMPCWEKWVDGLVDKVLKKESDQGVVIKVKCPDCSWSQFGDEAVGMTPCYRCNSIGYIFEPLIKE